MSGIPRAGRRASPSLATSTPSSTNQNLSFETAGITSEIATDNPAPKSAVSVSDSTSNWMMDIKEDVLGGFSSSPAAFTLYSDTPLTSTTSAASSGNIGGMGGGLAHSIPTNVSTKLSIPLSGRRSQTETRAPSLADLPSSIVNPFPNNLVNRVEPTTQCPAADDNIDDLWGDGNLRSSKGEKGISQPSWAGSFGESNQSPVSSFTPTTMEGNASDVPSMPDASVPLFMMDSYSVLPVTVQRQQPSGTSYSTALPSMKPLTLREQEAELLSQLHETERDITQQELEIISLNGDLRREEESYKVKEADKEREKEKELTAVDKKRREDLHYLDLKKEAIKSKNEEDLNDLDSLYRKGFEDRSRRICEELQDEVNKIKKDIDKLEDQKELLLKNGLFDNEDISTGKGGQTPHGSKRNKVIYARLIDASTLEDKLQAATRLLIDHHRALDNRVEQRVGHIIYLESSSASSASHERRRKGFLLDSEARHNTVSQFKSEMMTRLSNFNGTRHEKRNEEVLEIQEAQKRYIMEMRESCQKAVSEANEAAKVEFKLLVEKFKGDLEAGILHLKQRHRTITEDDSKIGAAQSRELVSRLELTRRLQEKIEADQQLSLKELGQREEARWLQMNEMSLKRFTNELHGKCAVGEPGSTWNDVREITKHLAELGNAIDSIIANQTERNTALRAISQHACATSAGDGPKRGSSLACSLPGLTPEEVTVLSLLDEKKAVLDTIMSTVRLEQHNLDESRCRLQEIVDEFVMKMTSLMGQVHDGRLQQQSQLSRTDVIRTQWAKEHRSMLFHKHCDESRGDSDTDNPLSSFNASMNILLGLAKQVRTSAVKHQEHHQAFVQKMNVLNRQQKEHDSIMGDQQSDVEVKWEQLFEKLLSMNDTIKKVSEKHIAVLSEEAKFSVESDLLSYEKRTLAQKAIILEQDKENVHKDIHAAQREHAERLKVTNQLEREQREANKEVRSLIRQQADLLENEAEHYRELRRIGKMKEKLRPAGITKSTGWLQDSQGVVEAFKRGVHDYPVHRGGYRDRLTVAANAVAVPYSGSSIFTPEGNKERAASTPQTSHTNPQERSAIPNNDDSFVPAFYYPTTASSETDCENRNRLLTDATPSEQYPMPPGGDITNTFRGANTVLSGRYPSSNSPSQQDKNLKEGTSMTADDKKHDNWSVQAEFSVDEEDATSRSSSIRTSIYEETEGD